MLIIDIITIFPQMFENITSYGVIKESESKDICRINIYNLRDYTTDKHRKVDDRPYGGGPGMVMTVQPIDDAVSNIKQKNIILNENLQKVILLTPRGERLNQQILRNLAAMENLILICGRYEGVDERISLLTDFFEKEKKNVEEHLNKWKKENKEILKNSKLKVVPFSLLSDTYLKRFMLEFFCNGKFKIRG